MARARLGRLSDPDVPRASGHRCRADGPPARTPPDGGGRVGHRPKRGRDRERCLPWTTGVRFRELPLTPERVLAGLPGGEAGSEAAPEAEPRRRFPPLLGSIAVPRSSAPCSDWAPALALPIHSAIAPIIRPDASTYSAATIERGRLLAALGACAVCHTMPPARAVYAGGLRLLMLFGTVVATNITPDVETGIGAWSYPAFERAMRQGIHRDGPQSLPGLSVSPSFTKAKRRRPSGALRLSDDPTCGEARSTLHPRWLFHSTFVR